MKVSYRQAASPHDSYPAPDSLFVVALSAPSAALMGKWTYGRMKTKDLHSIYLFYGDEYLVKEQVEKLVGGLLDPKLRSTNLIVLDGANLDVSQVYSHVFTPSLFGGFRVVVVDQTPMFMGKVDLAKVVAKVTAAWRSNDRKSALKGFGQLLSLAGVDRDQISRGSEWTGEVLEDSGDPQRKEALSQVARLFLESDKKLSSGADESLLEELIQSSLPKKTVLIFTAPGVDKRKKLFRIMEKRARVVDCTVKEERYGPGPDKAFFEDRVRETLSAAGKKISPRALQKMYERSGKEIRLLNSELEKLIAYLGDRKEVTVQDVESLFQDFHQAAFYELGRAIKAADPGIQLPALHDNLKVVEHPLFSLGTIANEFRRLMVARELLFTVFKSSWKRGMSYNAFIPVADRAREEHPELCGKGKLDLLSMKDYPLYMLLTEAQRFPLERLIRIMEAIHEADVMIKSTKVGGSRPEYVLENLALLIGSRPADKG